MLALKGRTFQRALYDRFDDERTSTKLFNISIHHFRGISHKIFKYAEEVRHPGEDVGSLSQSKFAVLWPRGTKQFCWAYFNQIILSLQQNFGSRNNTFFLVCDGVLRFTLTYPPPMTLTLTYFIKDTFLSINQKVLAVAHCSLKNN
ncbi:hypothetical protein EAI_10199 [Harpegnathos saltator]|uniref:Uncharacterized protein n=1 Tax=Harpegnathos saltator TaxID=610380 RepID=E2BYP9_HARSA|nr:hypothetical protein EAI_10199 [Harpegnathos saltator]